MKNLAQFVLYEINPYSWVVTIGLDLLWNWIEAAAIGTIAGIIVYPFLTMMIFAICFLAVTLIQVESSKDPWGVAMVKGAGLGIIAALPCSIVGLIAGAIAGLLHITYRNDEEIVQLGSMAREWRNLEQLLRRKLRSYSYRREEVENDEMLIDFLFQKGALSRAEKDALQSIRVTRNAGMHAYTPQDLGEKTAQLREINERLAQRFK